MDPLPENEFTTSWQGKMGQRVLDGLRFNDPPLKELTITIPYRYSRMAELAIQMILQAVDAIATNSSLEILNIEDEQGFLSFPDAKDRVTRALSLNTSLKDVRILAHSSMMDAIDIIMACPSLEALSIRGHYNPSNMDFTAMLQVFRHDTKLHSLTIENIIIEDDRSAAFGALFQENKTIKTLIMRNVFIDASSTVSFVEALPQDHALEAMVFDGNLHVFNDEAVVHVIQTLCHTPLKALSLVAGIQISEISQNGCTRIIQTLKENKHSFTKLDLFQNALYAPWHNFMQLEIEKLTWENHLQVQKDRWVDQFLEHDTPTKDLLFFALERAKKVDNNEQVSKAPNMVFYIVKELPDLIAQACHP